jgi:hypothetical protein
MAQPQCDHDTVMEACLVTDTTSPPELGLAVPPVTNAEYGKDMPGTAAFTVPSTSLPCATQLGSGSSGWSFCNRFCSIASPITWGGA